MTRIAMAAAVEGIACVPWRSAQQAVDVRGMLDHARARARWSSGAAGPAGHETACEDRRTGRGHRHREAARSDGIHSHLFAGAVEQAVPVAMHVEVADEAGR